MNRDIEHRSLQYLLFIRALFSSGGDIAVFPNTEKLTQRVGKNGETEEYVLDERTGQNHSTARDLREMEISKIFNREFILMIIKMNSGLEKSVEDISATLTATLKKNKNESEIKNKIIKIKNILDRINNRLEEAQD